MTGVLSGLTIRASPEEGLPSTGEGGTPGGVEAADRGGAAGGRAGLTEELADPASLSPNSWVSIPQPLKILGVIFFRE